VGPLLHPTHRAVPALTETFVGNEDSRTIIRGLEEEMARHRRYSKEYGYVFFILSN
jgi:hypothetical protein